MIAAAIDAEGKTYHRSANEKAQNTGRDRRIHEECCKHKQLNDFVAGHARLTARLHTVAVIKALFDEQQKEREQAKCNEHGDGDAEQQHQTVVERQRGL